MSETNAAPELVVVPLGDHPRELCRVTVEGYQELVVVQARTACETFCDDCGQLRLWTRAEPPTACGGCGSVNLHTGAVGNAELPERRRRWREGRP